MSGVNLYGEVVRLGSFSVFIVWVQFLVLMNGVLIMWNGMVVLCFFDMFMFFVRQVLGQRSVVVVFGRFSDGGIQVSFWLLIVVCVCFQLLMVIMLSLMLMLCVCIQCLVSFLMVRLWWMGMFQCLMSDCVVLLSIGFLVWLSCLLSGLGWLSMMMDIFVFVQVLSMWFIVQMYVQKWVLMLGRLMSMIFSLDRFLGVGCMLVLYRLCMGMLVIWLMLLLMSLFFCVCLFSLCFGLKRRLSDQLVLVSEVCLCVSCEVSVRLFVSILIWLWWSFVVSGFGRLCWRSWLILSFMGLVDFVCGDGVECVLQIVGDGVVVGLCDVCVEEVEECELGDLVGYGVGVEC